MRRMVCHVIKYKIMSKNGIALAVLILEAVLSAMGVEFEVGSVEKVVEGVVVLVALALAIRNQMDRVDIRGFFFKK